jgi:hypothetical protein
LISDAPTIAARDPAEFESKLAAFVAIARLKAADGITIAELAELLLAFLRTAIAAVDAMPTDGAAKKALVLSAVGIVFDGIADYAAPTLAYPVWIVVRPAVRALVLACASGAVEALLPMVRAAQ